MRGSYFLHLKLLGFASSFRCGLTFTANKSSRAFYPTTFKSMMSTMKTTRVFYEPIEDVERLEHYKPGGYHPVTIGGFPQSLSGGA